MSVYIIYALIWTILMALSYKDLIYLQVNKLCRYVYMYVDLYVRMYAFCPYLLYRCVTGPARINHLSTNGHPFFVFAPS